MNTDILNEINNILLEAKVQYNSAKQNKVTLKAQKEIRALGLGYYLPAWMMEKGAKCDRQIDAVIRAAKEDGTRVNRQRKSVWTLDGDAEVIPGSTYPISKLYSLLNPVVQTATNNQPFEIYAISSDYNQIPTGKRDEDFGKFVAEHDLEVMERNKVTATVRAEWGNGEGYDVYAVTFFA